jgi:hypothetical protein
LSALNLIQRKALADSVGVSVSELSKMVGQTDKLTLSGAMAAGSFDDLAGQKALSNLSSITNEVKALFTEALILIGPEIEKIVGHFRDWLKESGGVSKLKEIFLSVAGVIKDLITALPTIIGLFVTLKGLMWASTLVTAAFAAATSAAATPWLLGGGALIAIASIGAGIAAAKEAMAISAPPPSNHGVAAAEVAAAKAAVTKVEAHINPLSVTNNPIIVGKAVIKSFITPATLKKISFNLDTPPLSFNQSLK